MTPGGNPGSVPEPRRAGDKPGGRTRFARADDRGRPRKLPTAPVWVFVASVAAVVADAAGTVLSGRPMPMVQIAVLVVVLLVRRRDLTRAARPRVPEPVPALAQTPERLTGGQRQRPVLQRAVGDLHVDDERHHAR